MKKANLVDYNDFFLELPPTDYLADIEIQDEYEQATDTSVHGLSDEQVSQIAIDSLTDPDPFRNSKQSAKSQTHPNDSPHNP